ncbi:MAG: FAD-dependent oxidoreductase [Planctomycetes bacterium]|nr:FAD-dependent oxidoreductase [Planctomycetota bacterium]
MQAATRRILAAVLLVMAGSIARAGDPGFYDVVIYGGTSAAMSAAVQARAMGKTVVVVSPDKHLGGMTSGGLGATDIGNKGAIGGISRTFYHQLYLYYHKPDEFKEPLSLMVDIDAPTQWTMEPHVAELIYDRWMTDHHIVVCLEERLKPKNGVQMLNNRIVSITCESGGRYSGKMFIDATYEGDLMAQAGVSYTVGREANSQYHESLNGVQTRQAHSHQFTKPVDPYVKPGDPSSGLLPGVHAGGPGEEGAADKRVQAYNFRMCLTDDPENRLPFPKPDGYDPARYELLLRYYEAGYDKPCNNFSRMPNHKTDCNNTGAFSTDNIGMNYDYPEGDYETRKRIYEDHRTYQLGLMWTMANNPRVPEKLRNEYARKWGLSKDEFADNDHWPYALYVREARRMIGDYVMTEHNCRGQVVAEDPIGLAAYTMDSHNTQRYVDADGHARNEGDVEVGGFPPYPISYRALVPKESQCENLVVPVCLSASHMAYGSIRMEPVFMILGQSAATIACMSIDVNTSVQRLDYVALREKLLADGQFLSFVTPGEKVGGLYMDDADAELSGNWVTGSAIRPFVAGGYRHDDNARKGELSAIFSIKVPKDGRYEVRFAYSALHNRATNIPITIEHAGGAAKVVLNEQKDPAINHLLEPLGTYAFSASKPARITVSNEGTDGYVLIDAVQLVPAK